MTFNKDIRKAVKIFNKLNNENTQEIEPSKSINNGNFVSNMFMTINF